MKITKKELKALIKETLQEISKEPKIRSKAHRIATTVDIGTPVKLLGSEPYIWSMCVKPVKRGSYAAPTGTRWKKSSWAPNEKARIVSAKYEDYEKKPMPPKRGVVVDVAVPQKRMHYSGDEGLRFTDDFYPYETEEYVDWQDTVFIVKLGDHFFELRPNQIDTIRK